MISARKRAILAAVAESRAEFGAEPHGIDVHVRLANNIVLAIGPSDRARHRHAANLELWSLRRFRALARSR